ncbi:hypothetical protein GQ54DRAFT_312028 [Martensiomyces pterosporus]|nr:hypothetical protein GQ54DRAFT_312028 [Martensiomyces pterosporus]
MLQSEDAGSLLRQAGSVLNGLLDAHSQGLSTTIYADAVALQTINAAVRGGILGLLQPLPGGGLRARNVRLLETGKRAAADGKAQQQLLLPDGEHALFLVGSVDWPKTCLPAIERVLASRAYSKCTLCVPTTEALWHDVVAVFPPEAAATTASFTADAVKGMLFEWLRAGQRLTGVSALGEELAAEIDTAPMLGMLALSDSMFVAPGTSQVFPAIAPGAAKDGDGFGFLAAAPQRGSADGGMEESTRKQVDRVSLNLMSLLQGLGLDGDFYSLGDTARRIARRCAGISRNTSGSSSSRKASSATVVVLDRTLDLVSPLHHSNNLLDQLNRALPRDGDALPLLASFRSAQASQAEDAESGQSLDLWEAFLMQERTAGLQILRRELVSRLAAVDGSIVEALPPMMGKVTSGQLQQLIEAYKAQPRAMDESCELVGIAESVVAMEKVRVQEHWSEIESAEKTLKLVLGGIKDSLAEAAASRRGSEHGSRRDSSEGDGGENSTADEAEAEMEAAWDQVLSSIPPVSAGMIERCVGSSEPRDSCLEELVPRWLLRHTPAPGVVLAAASLLAPTRVGVPSSQKTLAAQRLAADYEAVYREASRRSGFVSAQDVRTSADRWARQLMAYADLVAVSDGQRNGLTQWEQIAGLSHGLDGAYSPLLVRVAKAVVSGSGAHDLVHAEQGTAAAAASLLKGLGRRFLSGKSAGGGSTSGNDASVSTGHHRRHAGEAATSHGSSTVVFFVVGGVTFEEASKIAAVAHEHGSSGRKRVLVGGTGVCSPDSLCQAILECSCK